MKLTDELITKLDDVKSDLIDFLQSAVFENIENEEDILQLIALIGCIVDENLEYEEE